MGTDTKNGSFEVCFSCAGKFQHEAYTEASVGLIIIQVQTVSVTFESKKKIKLWLFLLSFLYLSTI